MNKHKYKKGDRVKALVDYRSLKKGKIYEVRKVREYGCSLWADKEKTCLGYDYMFFDEIEPVNKPKDLKKVLKLMEEIKHELLTLVRK